KIQKLHFFAFSAQGVVHALGGSLQQVFCYFRTVFLKNRELFFIGICLQKSEKQIRCMPVFCYLEFFCKIRNRNSIEGLLFLLLKNQKLFHRLPVSGRADETVDRALLIGV